MSAQMLKNKLPQLIAAMNALAKSEVLVGIPSDSEKNTRDDALITNAEIGYINEFGASELNIPPRPFLIPGVQAAWPDAEKYMSRGARSAMKGEGDPRTTVDKALNGAGLLAQASVVQEINDGLEPELADSTIAARQRRRGVDALLNADGSLAEDQGEKPLDDTGSLKASITYVVKDQ